VEARARAAAGRTRGCRGRATFPPHRHEDGHRGWRPGRRMVLSPRRPLCPHLLPRTPPRRARGRAAHWTPGAPGSATSTTARRCPSAEAAWMGTTRPPRRARCSATALTSIAPNERLFYCLVDRRCRNDGGRGWTSGARMKVLRSIHQRLSLLCLSQNRSFTAGRPHTLHPQ
jgi:hypothetical protein